MVREGSTRDQLQLKGVILAAGLGTRLRPLTDSYPKPLVEVIGRPLIEWGLLSLLEAKISEVGVNTHYRGAQLLRHLTADHCQALARQVGAPSLQITWSHETTLLGTGGGLRALWLSLFGAESLTESPHHKIDEREMISKSRSLLCLNGDALFDFSLTPLIETHLAEGGAAGTLALREVPRDDPFGRVGVDAQGKIVRIAEVEGPRAHEEVRVGAFTGAQVISEEVAKHLSPDFSDTFRTAHRVLLDRDVELRAHFVEPDSLWLDIGNLERYLNAHRALLDRPESPLWAHIPPHKREGQRVFFEGATVAPTVQIHDHIWVGAGASLSASQDHSISESVIWRDTSLHLEQALHQAGDQDLDADEERPQTPHITGRVFTPETLGCARVESTTR